ncbi:MAG: GNAT family N-acetyltransferase [Bacteroides sp.]|nr:GNAT family N-acetyltransferase [Bacteroides sp.]MCM1413694.1 GNAT family N-acetyltransferase [Bacteroides sp.]MCM1471873.1 GNAT family N-acetyltransferase [Bacteroides sp.]
MMSYKNDIRHLWREGFKESEEYLDMYFGRIYNDGDALTIHYEDRLVSTLLLQPYSMLFYGRELPVSYICGAVTRRSARGRGYMSQLMNEAIHTAYNRGDMLCALIPNHDWLYFFFDRFGFSTVFLTDTQRFTSLHSFSSKENVDYTVVDDCYTDAVYDAFSQYERNRPGGILHTKRDFFNFLDNLSLHSDGVFVAVSRPDVPVAAMAWARNSQSMLEVLEVLGCDKEAELAAMRELRNRYPDTPMKYYAPSDTPGHRKLYSQGMARIVNVEMCLKAIAESNLSWRSSIKVSDPIIAANNHVYLVSKGTVTINDETSAPYDFDVDIEVLNRIVFSAPSTGKILGFPTHRSRISLMPH